MVECGILVEMLRSKVFKLLLKEEAKLDSYLIDE